MKIETFLVIVYFLACGLPSTAQDSTSLRTWYDMSGSELVYSFGELYNNGQKLEDQGRFTGAIHLNHQSHYDYTKSFGIYTGLSLINVGFIHKVPLTSGDQILLKQRSYSIGIPLALKFGNMKNRTYFALGAFVEYMFHYKMKVIYHDEKIKKSSWFPNEVNGFNPSLFAEFHFKKGFYLRFKYYMKDFLKNNQTEITIPGTAETVSFRPERSSLGYISIGWVFKARKKKHATKSEI
ncbi:MAG TPA: hypothetical protein VF691_09765 [Cytophagaceae bacterium]|jgi:hypothetical protein